MMQNNLKDQEGQSLILITFLAVAIIAFMGLLLDGGRVYAARRQSQNAADAAAFAAARELVTRNNNGTNNGAAEDAKILTVARSFATQNGVSAASDVVAYYINSDGSQGNAIGVYGYVPTTAIGVRVQATAHTQPFMIAIVNGGNQIDTESQATMKSGILTQFNGAMPMTVKYQSFSYGQTVQMMGQTTGPGGFQWLAETANTSCQGGGSAQDLANAIQNPPSTITKQADPSGNYLNPTNDASVNNLDHYFCSSTGISGADAVASALDYWLSLPVAQRHWIIPVYDYSCQVTDTNCTGGGNGSKMVYHIKAFAEFIPTGYYLSNSHSNGITKADCSLLDPSNPPQCVQGTFQGFTSLGHGDSGQVCDTSSGCALWLSE
ncbi:MAG: pilus assembly protein TadG-related protein [Anaerolineae bacterium]